MLREDGFVPTTDVLDEDHYAGPRLLVLDASAAARHRPGRDEACISIRDRGARVVDLSTRFVDVLRLAFDDVSLYAADLGPDARSITQEQADAVIAFFEQHRHRQRLVLHCTAGISRSRSAAAALADCYGLPYRFCCVNDDVARAVCSAFVRRSMR